MSLRYRLTKQSEWKHFKSGFELAIWFIAGALLIYFKRGAECSFLDLLVSSGVAFLVFFIPFSILHFRHEAVSKDVELEYDTATGIITICNTKSGMEKTFRLDEIRCVFHIMTPNFLHRRAQVLPWEAYNYSEIYLHDGSAFIITSLLVERLALPIDDKYQITTSLFPYPANIPDLKFRTERGTHAKRRQDEKSGQ